MYIHICTRILMHSAVIHALHIIKHCSGVEQGFDWEEYCLSSPTAS